MSDAKKGAEPPEDLQDVQHHKGEAQTDNDNTATAATRHHC